MLRYATIKTVTTRQVSGTGGGAVLWTVNVNTGAAGAVLKIYDGVNVNGILVATIDASTKSSHSYGVMCNEGIFLDLSIGAADCTVGYA